MLPRNKKKKLSERKAISPFSNNLIEAEHHRSYISHSIVSYVEKHEWTEEKKKKRTYAMCLCTHNEWFLLVYYYYFMKWIRNRALGLAWLGLASNEISFIYIFVCNWSCCVCPQLDMYLYRYRNAYYEEKKKHTKWARFIVSNWCHFKLYTFIVHTFMVSFYHLYTNSACCATSCARTSERNSTKREKKRKRCEYLWVSNPVS